MARTIDHNLHIKRYKAMLEYQEEIKPFAPTIRELQKLWGLHTTSAAFITLRHLTNAGLCACRSQIGSQSYYAIKAKSPSLVFREFVETRAATGRV